MIESRSPLFYLMQSRFITFTCTLPEIPHYSMNLKQYINFISSLSQKSQSFPKSKLLSTLSPSSYSTIFSLEATVLLHLCPKVIRHGFQLGHIIFLRILSMYRTCSRWGLDHCGSWNRYRHWCGSNDILSSIETVSSKKGLRVKNQKE
jgi:hypothetical protein